jgi:hypothetical protein
VLIEVKPCVPPRARRAEERDDAEGRSVSGRYRASTTWVVDFRYEGRPRRWFKVCRAGSDVRDEMAAQLRGLYGVRAQLVEVREATAEEEAQYLRGEAPGNVLCPTGRRPVAPDGTGGGAELAPRKRKRP